MNSKQHFVDQALDLLVYAPVGLALEAKELLPKLVERGQGQIVLTRLTGRFAVQQGWDRMERLFDELFSPASEEGPADHEDGPADGGDERGGDEGEVPISSGNGGDPARSGVMDGYDELTAPEVLARLEDISDTDLGEVLAYEEDHRSRVTVINRIRQLRDQP